MNVAGRLDGLTITPIVSGDGSLAFARLTVDTLPGLRVDLDAGAVRELFEALARVALISNLPSFEEPTDSKRADIKAQHDLDHATRSMP